VDTILLQCTLQGSVDELSLMNDSVANQSVDEILARSVMASRIARPFTVMFSTPLSITLSRDILQNILTAAVSRLSVTSSQPVSTQLGIYCLLK